MHPDRSIDKVYFHLRIGVVVLAVISVYSFYPRYLGGLSTPLPWFMHVHFALMVVWMTFLFLQPELIRKGDFKRHRLLGKISYLLVPMLMVTIYLMLRFGHHRILGEYLKQPELTPDAALQKASAEIGLGFLSLFILLIFYPLAIWYRRTPWIHAKYMVVASFSLIGPVVDRALFQLAAWSKTPLVNLPLEYGSFILIDVILFLMVINDFRKNHEQTHNILCLVLLIGAQIGYATIRFTPFWQGFVEVVL